MLSIYKPYKLDTSIKYVNDAITSTWISIRGKYIDKCINEIKILTGSKYVLLTMCGTLALHCSILVIKKFYPNIKKIYVPNNVYISLWNMLVSEYDVSMIEALDCDINTWNIDETKVLSLEKNSVLFVVHNVAGIVNVDKMKQLRPDILFFEDNCEGFLGKYNNKLTGTSSIAYTLSFNMNKAVTSGQGGAFVTDNKDIYDYVCAVSLNGSTGEKYKYKYRGSNYRLTNLQAAVLYSQFKLMSEMQKRKIEIFNYYKKKLNHHLIYFQKINLNTLSSYWYFALGVKNSSYIKVKNFMNKNNIEIRPMFYPINTHTHLKNIKYDSIDNAKILNKEVFFIPYYPSITKEIQNYVINTLLEYCDKLIS